MQSIRGDCAVRSDEQQYLIVGAELESRPKCKATRQDSSRARDDLAMQLDTKAPRCLPMRWFAARWGQLWCREAPEIRIALAAAAVAAVGD
ncbi:hypothetical protein L917_05468 [Phytophthora nicotianae]|uniref:Uncharacterized protein n=1 Tax=Phytophthora nicotianae TaxID=4792 RepID=W2LIK7_PHYNI|nr:hypothetical protein L917_05468 [Phytophthora nicotianae]